MSDEKQMTLIDVQQLLRRGNAAAKADLMPALRWLWTQYLEASERHSQLSKTSAQHQAKTDELKEERESFRQVADEYSRKFLIAMRQRDAALEVCLDLYEKVLATPEAPRFADLILKAKKAMKAKEENPSIYDLMVEALDFYADPSTYFAIAFIPDPPTGAFMEDFDETEELGLKPGKKARAVLVELTKPPPPEVKNAQITPDGGASPAEKDEAAGA